MTPSVLIAARTVNGVISFPAESSTMTPQYEINPLDFEQSREHEGDNKLFVVFYKATQLNEQKSMEAGRPVHDEVDLVKIIIPGQRDSVVAKADYEYQSRFPKQWAQYQARAEQIGSGTPLSEVTWLSMAQVADLKATNVHTVEQLANMADSSGHAFMGFQGLKQRAQAFLEAAAGNAPLLKMQAELESRDAKIAELEAAVQQLVAAQKKVPAKV